MTRIKEQPMTAHRKPADEAATTFVRRHIGPSPRDVATMLETVGAKTLSELIGQTLPSSIRQKVPLDLGRALSETEALPHRRELASRNQAFTSLIGQGPRCSAGSCNPLLLRARCATCGPQSPRCAERARLRLSPPICWR